MLMSAAHIMHLFAAHCRKSFSQPKKDAPVDNQMVFWLGAPDPNWLAEVSVPLFVSIVELEKRKSGWPRAACPWAMDSGGFSYIRSHGYYPLSPKEYAARVRFYMEEIGNLRWAPVQDWMCEEVMLNRTKMTVAQHQQLTVNSWIALRTIDSTLPWVPVIQGWTAGDYHRHVDLYAKHANIDLRTLPLVGIGSVCRRQGMDEAATIIRSLYQRGFRNLHGFGFKTSGLVGKHRLSQFLRSADSMAWSFRARMAWKHEFQQLCDTGHAGACNHCLDWALKWRRKIVGKIREQALDTGR